MNTKQIKAFQELVSTSSSIVVLQPDKPDGDSVASALALDEILSDAGKTVYHYCAGRVEPYLAYLPRWDIVSDIWPENVDMAIIVDCAANEQIPRLIEAQKKQLNALPVVLIDHHQGGSNMKFLDIMIIDEDAAATGELLFEIATKLKWPINGRACEYITSSILSDTLNLTNSKTTPQTVTVFAKVVGLGNVNLHNLSQKFRESTAQDAEMLPVKGHMLTGVEFYAGGQIAIATVTEEMIEKYRHKTNLAVLVFFDMLNTRGVKLAVVMNDYGKIIRTSMRAKLPVADKIATHFGGGGHPMAAAFPCTDKTLAELKPDFVAFATQAISTLNAETMNEIT